MPAGSKWSFVEAEVNTTRFGPGFVVCNKKIWKNVQEFAYILKITKYLIYMGLVCYASAKDVFKVDKWSSVNRSKRRPFAAMKFLFVVITKISMPDNLNEHPWLRRFLSLFSWRSRWQVAFWHSLDLAVPYVPASFNREPCSLTSENESWPPSTMPRLRKPSYGQRAVF